MTRKPRKAAVPKVSIYALVTLALIIIVGAGVYWLMPRTSSATLVPREKLAHFGVFLQHKPCVGNCPVYAVLANGNGKMQYVGVKNVAATTTVSLHINDQQLSALYRATAQAGFMSIDDIYHNGTDGTGCQALQRGKPRLVIGVTKSSKTHIIHYDVGCKGAPASLKHLAHQIDAVLNTAALTGADESTE